MAIRGLNNKFYKVNFFDSSVAREPFKVYFSEDDVNNLKKILKTKEGKKMSNRPLRKIVREIINRYIEDHSE